MAPIDGFKLTFSDGTVFRCTNEVTLSHETQPLYLLDGLRNFVTVFNTYIDSGGTPGKTDSNYAGVFAGFGAGIHQITVEFSQNEGTSDTWGDATPASDSATTLMQELNRKLTTTKADSTAPADLEVGEYNDTNGDYNPIPVALGETSLSFQIDDGQHSSFTGRMTFFDTVSMDGAVDAQVRE